MRCLRWLGRGSDEIMRLSLDYRLRRSELLHLGAHDESHFGGLSGGWQYCELRATTPHNMSPGHQRHRQHGEDLESAAREPCDKAPRRFLGEDGETEPVSDVWVEANALGDEEGLGHHGAQGRKNKFKCSGCYCNMFWVGFFFKFF